MKRSGISLAETVISLFVIGIVIVISLTAYTATGQFTSDEEARIVTGVEASRVLGELDELLRQGTTVSTQYPSTGAATYTTDASTLIFAVPSIINGDPSQTKTDTVVARMDTTDSSNKKLVLQVIPDLTAPASTRAAQTRTLMARVSDAYFRYNQAAATGATEVTTTVSTTRTLRGRTFTQTIMLNATLRNHNP